jgi:HEAT repeat protein
VRLSVLAVVATGLALLHPFHIAAQRPAGRSSAAILSTHHLEALKSMDPQQQAELLLERTINGYRGASDEIAARAPGWLGQIATTPRFEALFRMAINSDDMRVRAAAVDANVSARGLVRSPISIERLEPAARIGPQGPRANALWDIALLGNRGVQPERAFEIIRASIGDPNENIRYWAVESLAFLGTDEVIEPLLDIFKNDESALIRERAACSLAQSGMLNEQQRWRAVPKLLDYADDFSIDPQTREWIFQALRDITGKTLPHDGTAWRTWYTNSRQ